MNRDELVAYMNDELSIETVKDYGPNGLQVEGKRDIQHIVTGVTASKALIDQAIELKADMLLVHHGIFWERDPYPLVGMKHQRVKSLLAHDINLCGYHLPLDIHMAYGNNKQLANCLGFAIDQSYAVGQVANLLWIGSSSYTEGTELSKHIHQTLAREPLHIAADRTIKKIAWCTGAAQDMIVQAIELGADAFITGEVSERTVHIAREYNVHFYAAGHHATERYGIKAFGEHLATTFSLHHTFLDLDNPV